jgi:pyruvate dehydrogenase E2 component (dihydrolipoamide acetyltransferase)
MPISVVMPALEMAQETGKLVGWLKKEGERVAKGEPLLEIETDKAIMEIESPGDGVLGGIKATAGAEIPVGRTIAWILAPGETAPLEEVRAESGRRLESASGLANPPVSDVTAPAPGSRVKISPKAKRLAQERGLDLAGLHGSGPAGELLASDILTAAHAQSAKTTSQAVNTQESLGPIPRLMAERTAQSWTTVPHFFVTREAEAGALNETREHWARHTEKAQGIRVTHSDLLVALVARVLRQHPRLNSSWTSDGIRGNDDINIGLAIALDEGVVAPVIPNADKITIGQIATQRKALSERARAAKLRPQDLARGTFTISNLGMFNVDAFSAIIIPPQAAILAVGRIADRVVAHEGNPAIRPTVRLTLSVDHRVAGGAQAARFLDDLAQALMNPEMFLELG